MDELPATKKNLGQHWLTDPAALQAICEAGQVAAADTVLEVGPGPGTLTTLLVQAAGQVTAVEFDRILAAELPKRVKAANLLVVQQDILSFDLTGLPPDYKVVANIPYYLTSNLLRVLSETPNRAARVVLLVQKEVAERVAAKPGGMSLLSVSAQFYWEVRLGEAVPARLFTPPPKVDSQILILTRREAPLFPDVDEKGFFRLVKAGFSARRKTLLNSLSGGLRLGKDQVQAWLAAAGIETSLRPQNLSLDDWHRLCLTSPPNDTL
jgi:16S rRNA (adenine1518-N6/adenine1519-N6)-dimethyltransferase